MLKSKCCEAEIVFKDYEDKDNMIESDTFCSACHDKCDVVEISEE